MTATPAPEGRSRFIAAGLAAALTGILVVGIWIARGGPVTPHEAVTPPDRPRRAMDSTEETPTLARPPAARSPEISEFGRRVRQQLAARPPATRALDGHLSIEMRDLTWREPAGVVFARAATASGLLDLGMAAQGDVRLRDVVLRRADVNLRESPTGWNYDVVLADLLDGGEADDRQRLVQVDGVTIASSTVHVSMRERFFSLQDLDARLREAAFSGPSLPEPRIVVERAAAVLDQPAEGRRIALGVAAATARIREDTVAFDVETATIDGALLADLSGVWSPSIPMYGVLASGRAVDVRLEDVQQLLPERAPEAGRAAFRFSIEEAAPADPRIIARVDPKAGPNHVGGLEPGIDISLSELELDAGDSQILGSITFRVEPELVELRSADLRFEPIDVALIESFAGPLPFTGTGSGSLRGPADDLAFDVVTRLTMNDVPDTLAGRVTGRFAMLLDGFVLHEAEALIESLPLAVLRAWLPGWPLDGTATGRVALSGPPDRAPLTLDVDLELAAGNVTVAGTLDLTDPAPDYDLTGTLTGIDLQQLLPATAPPVQLDVSFALEGIGIQPDEVDADLHVSGQFFGWRAEPGDSVWVQARARAGVLVVDSAWARLATAAVSATGSWRFTEPASGSLRYAASVTSLASWGPYLPPVGDTTSAGALELNGSMEGTLDRPSLAGELSGEWVRAGRWAAAALEATYTARLGGPLPEGVVEIRASGIETPAENYSWVTLSAALAQAELTFELNAARPDSGIVEIGATGRIPADGPREIVLERAEVDLLDTRWSLIEPATFRWGAGAGLVVQGLEMRDTAGTGLVSADGRLLPLAELALDLEIAALPLGEVQSLFGIEPIVTGELWSTARVEGPGSTPTAAAEFRLENGTIETLNITRFDGGVEYASNRLEAHASIAIGAEGTFELELDLPAVIDFTADRKIGILESGRVAGSLIARTVSITPLQRLSWHIQDLAGWLDGSIQIAGDVSAPDFSGQLVLSQGAVRVPALRREFPQIMGQLVLSGRRVEVESFEVQSDGFMTVSGGATFETLTRPVLGLRVLFDRFRPAGLPGREHAAIFGDVSIDGPWEEVVITGDTRLADGDVRVPDFGPPPDDTFADFPELADGVVRPPSAFLQGLTIRDFIVRVDRNVWVDASAARAQLSGDLTLNRTLDAFTIVGTLSGERGTFTLEAGPIVRRFEILRAELIFHEDAEELDPGLDVLARRIVFDPNDRQVDVEVMIGGTLRHPTIGLATPGAPGFAESELIGILLFGRPTLEPGSGQLAGSILEGTLAELASLELEQALVRDLGLSVDVLEIRFGPGGIGGFGRPMFVIGVELATDVFLTAESSLGGLFSSTDTGTAVWALRLEWAFRRSSRLRVSYEPVTQSPFLRTFELGLRGLTQRQQLSFDLRRRWSY